MKRSLMLAGVCALALSACARPMVFKGTLTGAQEVPPVASTATGTATATLYPSSNALTYTVEYAGLSGPATGGHFHGPAAPGANAGVVVTFPKTVSPIKGGATLTEAQLANLMAGMWYANIHTAQHPGGEIRGQMLRTQ